jgi:dTDP-glucose pyrophosphorylase
MPRELYFYELNVEKYSKKLKQFKKGDLEITDLNSFYLKYQN